MQLSKKRLYTEPAISPAEPKSNDMSREWYVWFRFFDESTKKWKQLRFKKGINLFKVYKQRLAETNALKQALKDELESGWNPITNEKPNVVDIRRDVTVMEAIERIQKIKEKTLKRKTKYAYQYILKQFKDWLTETGRQDFLAGEITSAIAQQYMDDLLLKKSYSGRTFNDHLITLRTFYNCFVEREWSTKNPFRSVKKKSQTVGRNLAYTDEERETVAKYLYENDRRLYFLTQIIYHCFIRRTEIISIKVKHIDLRNGTIIIPGENAKNRHQESVVIPQDLMPVLKEMELHKYQSEFYLFGRCLETCAEQYKNPNWISTRHNDIVKRLNIDSEKGLYSWKHTGVCKYYYLTNKDVYALMRQLRHRDLSTTMIYLKSLGLIQNDAFRNATAA